MGQQEQEVISKEQEVTSTTTERKLSKPSKTAIPPEPPKICLGVVNGVSETNISEKGYCTNNFSINGIYGSLSGFRTWVWLPHFFQEGFDPGTWFKANTNYSSFVYYSNIIGHKNAPPGFMEVLCGGYDNPLFDALWNDMAVLCGPEWSDEDWANGNFIAKVNDLLTDFVNNNELGIGYILKQRRDSDTKEIVEGWNVDRVFIPNEENIKYWVTAATAKNGKYTIGFDRESGVPF